MVGCVLVEDRLPDLLSALAPRLSGSAGLVTERSSVGIVPAFLAVGKGVQAGVRWLQSDAGKRFLHGLKDTEKKAIGRQKAYQARADRETSPDVKARWLRRAEREQRKIDDARLTRTLTERGIIGEGPQLEYKRNLLAIEWEEAVSERKTEIEREIERMDRRLSQLRREQDLLDRTVDAAPASGAPAGSAKKREDAAPPLRGGERDAAMVVPWGGKDRALAPLPTAIRALKLVDKRTLSGMGSSRFGVQSPPGSGRLVRIPFYPEDDNQSWSGSGGIEFKNDDPVIKLTIDGAINNRIARTVLVRTERFDYGSYRILGFQVNEQGNSKPLLGLSTGQLTLGGIVITFSNLQLYNGQSLFLQEGQSWSAMYDIFPGGYSTNQLTIGGANSARLQLPGSYQRRRSRWFAGLRDYPLVTGTTFVSVQISAFSVLPTLVEDPIWDIPVTCNLVAEMVEDKVFGDVVSPSAGARGGATVKVAVREVGVNERGKEQLELVSARYQRASRE